MPSFFKKLFPIDNYREEKTNVYIEMKVHRKKIAALSLPKLNKYLTPYIDVGELGELFLTIPIKFCTNVLLSGLEAIRCLGLLITSAFQLMALDPTSSASYLLQSVNSFGCMTYKIASAIIDPMLTLSCLISRSAVSTPEAIKSVGVTFYQFVSNNSVTPDENDLEDTTNLNDSLNPSVL